MGLAAVLASARFAEADGELKWKLKQGETLKYQIVVTAKMRMGFNAFQRRDTMFDVDWSVDTVGPDGQAEITQTFKRVRYQMIVPPPRFQKIEYDSDQPAENLSEQAKPIAQQYQAIVGGQVKLKMSPTGKVSEMEVAKEMAAKLEELQKNAAGGGVSGEQLKQMLEQMTVAFPAGELEVGKSWTHSIKSDIAYGTVTTEMKYTLAEPEENGLERVEMAGEPTLEPSEKATVKMTMQEGDSKGHVLFDKSAGRIKEMEIVQKLELAGAAAQGGAGGAGNTTETAQAASSGEIQSKSVMKLVTAEAEKENPKAKAKKKVKAQPVKPKVKKKKPVPLEPVQ